MSATAALVLLALASPAAEAEAPSSEGGIEYAVLTKDGKTVGYQTHEQLTGANGRVISDEVMRVKLKRFGEDFEMITTLRSVENADGSIESVHLTINNGGKIAQEIKAVRQGEKMEISQKTGDHVNARVVPLGRDVLGPAAVREVLQSGPLAKGEQKSVKLFEIQTLQTADLTVTGLGETTTETRDGKPATLPAEETSRTDLPIKTTTFYDDAKSDESEVVRMDMGMLGLVAWPTTRQDAIATYGTDDVDLGLGTVVEVTPMPGLARDAKATLLVGGANDRLPPSMWQRITEVPDSNLQRVTSRRIDPRWFAAVGNLQDKTERENATKPSRLLDYESDAVQSVLKAAPEPSKRAGDTVADLAGYVRSVVSRVGFGVGFDTASDVCRSREGDCSEHAVLLAALLRGRGIPSRVAYGLVYGDRYSAFVPHMWTEAYLETAPGSGKSAWIPVDATRPTAPVGPAYLTFGTSFLESDAPLAIKELINLSQSVDTLSVRRIE